MTNARWYLPLLLLFFTLQPLSIFAQVSERPNPGFTLLISEVPRSKISEGYPPDYHLLTVTWISTSDDFKEDPVMDPENMLNMIVLRDGAPAQETDLMRDLRKTREAIAAGETTPSALIVPRPHKPRHSVESQLEISGYFDMSQPGTYTITVNRETFPFEPEKSVTVWSNTLTIVVPPATNALPAKE